jgi:hypothetical protein
MRIELMQSGEALALQIVDRSEPAVPVPCSLDERITAALADAHRTLPFAELRFHCRVRAATPSTSGLPRWLPPAASSRPTMAIASPVDYPRA